MPKKSLKKPTKTLDLDCKIDAIKSEIDEIDKEHVAIIPDVPNVPDKKEPKGHSAKPKIIEEIIEEDEPEPIIIRKIIKKKPQKIIEEIVQEEEPEPELEKPAKKKDGRGRPVGSYKKPRDNMELSQKQMYQQQSYNLLDETNMQMLKNDMQKEMRRRLMNSLFD